MSPTKIERTALVLVLGELGELDKCFAKLQQRHEWKFKQTPGHPQGKTVLLGAYGKRGSGDLYAFVGALGGCQHQGRSLNYEQVTRFWCPVTAMYGKHWRGDLMGERGAWGPHDFNYVLPAALTKVPKEAEALLKHDPR